MLPDKSFIKLPLVTINLTTKENDPNMYQKYCCARFGIRHEVSREEGINLRIVKPYPEYRMDNTNVYRFYLTAGYKEGQKKVGKHISIRYCPFCGTDLYGFYRSDFYINEEPGFF